MIAGLATLLATSSCTESRKSKPRQGTEGSRTQESDADQRSDGNRSGSKSGARSDGSANDARKTPGDEWRGPRARFKLCSDGLPADGMWKCDPHFVDLNKDGKIDLAAIQRLGRGPRTWTGNGSGTWAEKSAGLETGMPSCGGGIVAGDLNEDGILDLAVADHCQGVFTYLGSADGSWTMVTKAMYPKVLMSADDLVGDYLGAEDIDVADVNGDGHLDLVVMSNDAAGINLYHGDGTGGGWERAGVGLPSEGAGNRVMFVDLNNDGHQDVLAAHCDGPRVYFGNGKGIFSDGSTGLPSPRIGCLYRGTAVADVNNDGLLDIASANWVNGPEVYLQQADGSWKQTADVFPNMMGGAVGLDLGDLNGDGIVDMAVTGRIENEVGMVYGIFVLYGDGERWYHDSTTNLPGHGLKFTWGVTISDMNGDGKADLAVGSGGHVASSAVHNTQVLNQHLMVWCNE